MQRESIPAGRFTTEYREACRRTDQLFALIRPEYLTARPVRERHRLMFYIGHLEAFDWNLLSTRLLKQTSFAPDYDRLFAFGIDPVGGGLPTDVPEDWPTITQIHAYRDGVRARIESAIADVDFAYLHASVGFSPAQRDGEASAAGRRSETPCFTHGEPDDTGYVLSDADPVTLLQVAIEHRQMHAETLAYLIHQMPLSQKCPPASVSGGAVEHILGRAGGIDGQTDGLANAQTDCAVRESVDVCDMVHIGAGEVAIGLPVARNPGDDQTLAHQHASDLAADVRDAPSQRQGRPVPPPAGRPFGWDNEFIDADEQHVSVDAFWMDRHMVSNGDFLAFINAGGYANPQYWQPEDWAWRCAEGIEHPAFWRRSEAGWCLQTMFAQNALPYDWPVYVSHAEAAAYAHFMGKRLPTEAEWMRAAQGVSPADQPALEGNFDFRHWDPVPVQAYSSNQSRFGVHGQFGNGWEWTADFFAPFPGFRAFSFYPGYSADFFDDRHFVMKGGSPRTASRMLRPTFRNWFQPHYPYVYAGFRCVSRAAPDGSL